MGGNIGFFTLLSASKPGVFVDSFEPNMKNRMRMCESLNLNRWYGEYEEETMTTTTISTEKASSSHVNVYSYGVGSKAGMFNFSENPFNPGMGSFGNNGAGGTTQVTMDLEVITLDSFAQERNWFKTMPDIAILKVDVEGKSKGKNLPSH